MLAVCALTCYNVRVPICLEIRNRIKRGSIEALFGLFDPPNRENRFPDLGILINPHKPLFQKHIG